ncbi:MAG: YhbY family RNA-binding protein [Candidatus Pacearchaeota archaeon]
MAQGQVQLGKKGITDNFIETLRNHFKKKENVKISVLKNLGRDKKDMKKIKEDILKKLGENYIGKIIGFSIFLKKWRKPVRNNSE